MFTINSLLSTIESTTVQGFLRHVAKSHCTPKKATAVTQSKWAALILNSPKHPVFNVDISILDTRKVMAVMHQKTVNYLDTHMKRVVTREEMQHFAQWKLAVASSIPGILRIEADCALWDGEHYRRCDLIVEQPACHVGRDISSLTTNTLYVDVDDDLGIYCYYYRPDGDLIKKYLSHIACDSATYFSIFKKIKCKAALTQEDVFFLAQRLACESPYQTALTEFEEFYTLRRPLQEQLDANRELWAADYVLRYWTKAKLEKEYMHFSIYHERYHNALMLSYELSCIHEFYMRAGYLALFKACIYTSDLLCDDEQMKEVCIRHSQRIAQLAPPIKVESVDHGCNRLLAAFPDRASMIESFFDSVPRVNDSRVCNTLSMTSFNG